MNPIPACFCHLNMLNVLADAAARVPLTAREIGRNPEGTYGAREWWAIFGSHLAEQGVEDGPELCDQIARYFATNYCTMHVRSLRAHPVIPRMRYPVAARLGTPGLPWPMQRAVDASNAVVAE